MKIFQSEIMELIDFVTFRFFGRHIDRKMLKYAIQDFRNQKEKESHDDMWPDKKGT